MMINMPNPLLIIFMSLFIFLFSRESHAIIERKTDSYAGITTISSNIKSRVFVDFSIRLLYESVTFSKILERTKPMSQERTLDELTIITRIDADETILKTLSRHCPSGDFRKINDAYAYLVQAKESLLKSHYNLADCFEWKAREAIATIRSETYTLKLTISGTKDWWFFSNDNFEIKTNNNPFIYKALVLDTNSRMSNNTLTTEIIISIPKDLVEVINKSSNLSCKVYFNNSNALREPSTFEINGTILTEWKTIINNTE